MLTTAVNAYLQIRRAVGYELEVPGYLLRSFARYATSRGESHVRARTAMEWAAETRSSGQREYRLQVVATFARHARAEDARHEVPPIHVFARRRQRVRPHIYSPAEIQRLLKAASALAPAWPLRPEVFTTLFGLLASTGLRVSEALALRYGDVTSDGLIVRNAKFKKTRLVPLHPTASAALDRYLQLRRRTSTASDYLFIWADGSRLRYKVVRRTFTRLRKQARLGSGPQPKGPRIHQLRHTFAVRALEASGTASAPIGRYVRALSTYLGHSSMHHTCWYLQATPHLMRDIADACERLLDGGRP